MQGAIPSCPFTFGSIYMSPTKSGERATEWYSGYSPDSKGHSQLADEQGGIGGGTGESTSSRGSGELWRFEARDVTLA
jgi:hypothetical protein